jgi:hypothetical protein
MKGNLGQLSDIALGYGLGIFIFTTASRLSLGPTQPHIQWVPGALSLGVKRPGREAEIWKARSFTHTPLIRLHGMALS